MAAKRGRLPTTGRFNTREELEEFIWETYWSTEISQEDLARRARISPNTLRAILNKWEKPE